MSKPGYADPLAQAERRHIGADEIDAADDFMTGNDRVFDVRKLPVENMEIGPADPARTYFDADFAIARPGIGPLLGLKRRSRRPKYHRTH